MSLEKDLEKIVTKYQQSFSEKIYKEENDDYDLMMDVFGISPDLKRENRQYWGRELGMCWQMIVTKLCEHRCKDFGPALKFGADEPCDLTVGKYAIDTKYRIGSGDSGTLKKFKSYGPLLIKNGYQPIFLIVRNDNLPAAITACGAGQWEVKTGETTYEFLEKLTEFNIKEWLINNSKKGQFLRKNS